MQENSGVAFFREACRRGIHDQLLEDYLEACRPPEGAPAKEGGRFPNLAGFCRFLKMGTEDLLSLSEDFPDILTYLYAVFEDEALNASVSPSLTTAYLKRRLGYEKALPEREGTAVALSPPTVCFEHDIFRDGG